MENPKSISSVILKNYSSEALNKEETLFKDGENKDFFVLKRFPNGNINSIFYKNKIYSIRCLTYSNNPKSFSSDIAAFYYSEKEKLKKIG